MKERRRQSPSTALKKVMEGATREDWHFLASIPYLSKFVHKFNLQNKSIEPINVPWPIVWLLARFNRKHIFAKNDPDDDKLMACLRTFEDKISWSWLLKDNDTAPLMRIKGQQTTRFTQRRAPALSAWLGQIRSTVIRVLEKTTGINRRNGGWSNVIPLTRLAMRLYRDSGLVAIVNDKEPGYTLHSREDAVASHQSLLEGPTYQEEDENDICIDSLFYDFKAICKEVSIYENNKRWLPILLKPWRSEKTCIAATLQLTTKSTKPAGKVCHRNVHAAPANKLVALSEWLNITLNTELSKQEHLLMSTEQFTDKVTKNIIPQENDVMVRIDLKDFFMSGNPISLSNACAKVIRNNPAKQKMVRKVAKFLMEHQWVESDLVPGRLFKVRRGSGMGLRHSSSVCDAALLALSEIPFALVDAAKKKFGIKSYYRFRDDIWILTNKPDLFDNWFHIFRRRCSDIFICQLEEISPKEVTMLAVKISIVKNKFSIAPRDRQHDGPFLSKNSAHPPHVHKAWPFGVLRGIISMCTPDRRQDAVAEYLARFKRHHAPLHLIKALRESSENLLRGAPPPGRVRISSGNVRWLVLPWHPAYSRSRLSQELRELVARPDMALAFSDAFGQHDTPSISVSWTNALPTHFSVVKRIGERNITRSQDEVLDAASHEKRCEGLLWDARVLPPLIGVLPQHLEAACRGARVTRSGGCQSTPSASNSIPPFSTLPEPLRSRTKSTRLTRCSQPRLGFQP